MSCMAILFLGFQITSSDIRPHISWAVSLEDAPLGALSANTVRLIFECIMPLNCSFEIFEVHLILKLGYIIGQVYIFTLLNKDIHHHERILSKLR